MAATLPSGRTFGAHLVDADRGGHRAGGALVVAGEQHRGQAEVAQPGDGVGRGVLDGVGQGDHADRRLGRPRSTTTTAVSPRPWAASTGGTGRSGGRAHGVRPSTTRTATPSTTARTPSPGTFSKGVQRAQPASAAATIAWASGCSEPDSAVPASAEQVGVGDAVGRGDADDAQVAAGDGAGLVEGDGADGAGALEHVGPGDDDAHAGAASGADEQRGRGGQAERAGAGDDQHGDGGGGREQDGLAREQPADEGEGGDDEHDRHEDARDPVGERLDGRLAGLGLLDHAGHAGQLGVGAERGGADDEASVGVQGGADHGVAGGLVDGHRLAGDHRLVDRGRPRDDHDAVGGDLLAGADDELVVELEEVDRDRAPRRRRAARSPADAPSVSRARSASELWLLERASNQRPASRNVMMPTTASK